MIVEVALNGTEGLILMLMIGLVWLLETHWHFMIYTHRLHPSMIVLLKEIRPSRLTYYA
jgi:hypothetical protein